MLKWHATPSALQAALTNRSGVRSINRNQRSVSLEYSPNRQLNHHTLPDKPKEVVDPH